MPYLVCLGSSCRAGGRTAQTKCTRMGSDNATAKNEVPAVLPRRQRAHSVAPSACYTGRQEDIADKMHEDGIRRDDRSDGWHHAICCYQPAGWSTMRKNVRGQDDRSGLAVGWPGWGWGGEGGNICFGGGIKELCCVLV